MSDIYTLEFESPLKEIEDKIKLLLSTSSNTGIDVYDKVQELKDQLTVKTQEVYGNLSRFIVRLRVLFFNCCINNSDNINCCSMENIYQSKSAWMGITNSYL